jgi:hypothetical protein
VISWKVSSWALLPLPAPVPEHDERGARPSAAECSDLSKKNADKLAKIFEPYIAAARKTGANTRRTARSPRLGGPSPQEVRTWARAEGIEVKDKGRVPAELIVRFQAAQ